MQLTTRNATLGDLAELLKQQHAAKLDLVAPAHTIRSQNGVLLVEGTDLAFDGDEPRAAAGLFLPTEVCDETIAAKLDVPVGYLKRMRAARPDLYDANVNGWLAGGTWRAPNSDGMETVVADADERSFMLRLFRGDPEAGNLGVARAMLSQSYKRIDNFDVLTAALDGVKEAGVKVDIVGCDLTERRMHVRIVAPEVKALAPVLLRDYRSPFNEGGPDGGGMNRAGWTLARAREAAARENKGYGPGAEPVVFAGFVIGNSETGGGAFTITPRIEVQVCRNGLVITRDALRNVHLGSRLDDGIVRWTDDTQRKNLELVAAQARDAVATFLDADYVAMVMERIEEQAGTAITKPAEAIKVIGQQLRFSQERTDDLLNHFILGGQATAGGVLNAVTSLAQTIEDADDAAEVEALGLRALELAAAAN